MRPFTAVVFVFTVLLSAAVASGAVPETRRDTPHGKLRPHCLTTHEAEDLRDLWISFFEKISDGGAQARNSVTDDIKVYSESINFVTPGRTLPVFYALPSPHHLLRSPFVCHRTVC